ncbi:MAG: hypothetical protein ACKVOI_06240 [Dongiaceae bacterium]
MLTKALFLSVAVVAALSLPASAGGPGGDDRGTRIVVLQRGGWDGNGPDMLGAATDDRGTRLYRRGGWDANGPALTGAAAQVPQTEVNLEGLSVDSIEFPQAEAQAMMQR